MKKILSLVLVAAMLASMLVFVPAAGATEVPTVAAGSVKGTPGETVMVPVTVTADDFITFSALVEYDGERLAFKEVDFSPLADLAEGYKVPTNEDAVYLNWYDNGSFVSFSWTAADGVTAEAAEGAVVVNIIFTVKETAPVGAAYVAVRDYGAVNDAGNAIYGTLIKTSDEYLYQGAGNIACENGGVLVLPEGWIDTTPSAAKDFTISNGNLTKYTGADDVVVIPSTVTSIAKAAFKDSTVKTVIIPASVETIGEGAFLNCAELTDVYILGSDTKLGKGCIGFAGTYTSKTKKVTLEAFYYGDEDCLTSLTTIHAVANDNVVAYAENGDAPVLPFDEDPELEITPFFYELLDDGYTVSFGGFAAFAPANTNTKVPGQMVIDGKTVVAWRNGDAVVTPGADLVLTADIALEPITIKAPVTSTEAGIKANADVQKAGLRFTATLDIADYEALAALGTVELGMLVTPAAYVAKAGAFTKTALDAIKKTNATYVDIALGGYFDKSETEYTFAAQLTNFSKSTYDSNPNFVAVMYATVTINGVATTVYGAYNWEGMQNVKDLATAAKAVEGTDTVKKQLEALIAKFN